MLVLLCHGAPYDDMCPTAASATPQPWHSCQALSVSDLSIDAPPFDDAISHHHLVTRAPSAVHGAGGGRAPWQCPGGEEVDDAEEGSQAGHQAHGRQGHPGEGKEGR